MPRLDGFFDFWKKKAGAAPRGGVPIRDLYGILGLELGAGVEEIRSAYRKLAMRYHPDRNPGNSEAYEKYIEITKAHDLLVDPAKRKQYDAALRAATEAQAPRRGEPSGLSTFRQKEGAKKAPEPRKRHKAAPMAWDVMFDPWEDATGGSVAIYEALPGPRERRTEAEAPWDVMFPERVVVDMPSREKLLEGVAKLDLPKIWDFIRGYRTDPRFLASKSLVIGPVAGSGGGSIGQDLANLTGASAEQVTAYVGRKGIEKAWYQILGPLAEQAALAIESQKPSDLPGSFYMDWDPSGSMLELLYGEFAG